MLFYICNLDWLLRSRLEWVQPDQIPFVAIGTAPTLTIKAPLSSDLVTIGDSVSCAVIVEDQEDIPSDITISWVSDIDGIFSAQGSDSSGNIAFGYNSFSPQTPLPVRKMWKIPMVHRHLWVTASWLKIAAQVYPDCIVPHVIDAINRTTGGPLSFLGMETISILN